eukprot:jgi/Orpsp1_1/1183115/evm.model.c7180000083942.2
MEGIKTKRIGERKYHSPLFNKTTLELSDLKNSPTRRSSFSVSRPILPPRISSKIIDKNTFNDNLIRFSKMNGAPKLDSFLHTYDRIVNSIRIGFGNKSMIPKKKRITINKKFMHDLANNKYNKSRNYSLNVNPCITMKPIVNILLKSVEVVINEKTKPNEKPKLIENDKDKDENNDKLFTGYGMTESPKQSPTIIISNTENNNMQSEEIVENNKREESNTNLSLLRKKSTNTNQSGNTLNTLLSLESIKTLKGEGKTYKDILLDSDSFKQLYDSISRDINLIENITKSEKEIIDPTSYTQNDPSDTLFITNQIDLCEMNREHIRIDENGNNINGILFRTDSMSKLYKDIMNNNDLSADTNTIDKTAFEKTLVTENPLRKEIQIGGPKDYSLSEVYSYSTNSNIPKRNLKSVKQNSNPFEASSSNNLNEEIPQINQPVKLLRRSSSLGSKKEKSKKYEIPSNLDNKNGITGILDNKQKRYSYDVVNNIKSSNNFEYPNKYSQFMNTNNYNNLNNNNNNYNNNNNNNNNYNNNYNNNNNNINNNYNNNNMINTTTINNNNNNNNNINNNINNVNNVYNSTQKLEEMSSINNTNNSTSLNDNQIINQFPMIPRRRSSVNKKHRSANLPIRRGSQSNMNIENSSQNNPNENNNNNNINNININNVNSNNPFRNDVKEIYNNRKDKRYSVDTAAINRINNKNNHRIKPLLNTPKRSLDASLKNKSPTPIRSPNNTSHSTISTIHSPNSSHSSMLYHQNLHQLKLIFNIQQIKTLIILKWKYKTIYYLVMTIILKVNASVSQN